ncbi:hypothetical protein HanHA300_Chr08g0264541 [Helianthus annuus]|nr:hypothetical protein HanHA300_Chr08g0264541 [Helianthus annuus]KAJ0717830.1 hypothetical protein HanLR1_Chr08g0263511 [Helianthus annuus]
MDAGVLLRTLKPSNTFLKKSIGLRCSSSSNSPTTATVKNRAYDGLLLDAGGTLLQLAKPVADTYASIGLKYATFVDTRNS